MEMETTAVVLPAPVLQACMPTLNVHILEEKIDLEFEFEIGLKVFFVNHSNFNFDLGRTLKGLNSDLLF